MSDIAVRPARLPGDLADVQSLCWAYREYLLNFGPELNRLTRIFYPESAYADLMAALPEKHARPDGIIMVAETEGRVIGCGMFHRFDASSAEIKRVYVEPGTRGTGVGRALTEALIEQARASGYARIYLDTSRDFTAARSLYSALGFQERGPYAKVPPDIVDKLRFYQFEL